MRLVALEVVKLVWAILAIFHRRFLSGRRMWIFAGLGGDGNHNNDDLPSLNDLWEGAIRPARRRGSFVAMNNMDGVSSWVSLIVFFFKWATWWRHNFGVEPSLWHQRMWKSFSPLSGWAGGLTNRALKFDGGIHTKEFAGWFYKLITM